MAVAYLDEEEVWSCATHPSERRRHGVCPICLRDKLISLCPNCANVRPCDCPVPIEPIFKRSRSLALSLLRSKGTQKTSSQSYSGPPCSKPSSSSSFWSKLKTKKRDKDGGEDNESEKKMSVMMRSKTVGAALFSNFGSFRESGRRSSAMEKSKGWFISPIKALKQSKAANVNHANSLIGRG